MAIELAERPPAHELTPVADAVTTALAEITKANNTFTELAATGRELAERYANVVADVTTVKGYEQIATIRTELRKAVRYPMQDLKKTGSKMLGEIRAQFNERAEALIAEAEAHEAPFQSLLDAEDARKAAIREENERKEAARKQAHAEAIAGISSIPGNMAGADAATIELTLTGLRDVIIDEGYEEFQGQAQQAKDEAVRLLTGMLVAARADEADRAELEEERRRQAAFAEQQRIQREAAEAQAAQDRAAREAAERETAELRAKLEAAERREQEQAAERERAARERAEAIQRRIDAIKTAGAPLEGRTAEQLASIYQTVAGCVVTEDLLGDRTAEAEDAIAARCYEVAVALEAAEVREAEEAAAAQRTRRNELLSTIVGMGENALLAVADGSADVAQLEANRGVIAETELTDEVWGDLLQQAVAARSEALRKTDEAIAATKERDRLAAEEAERQRIEAEEARLRHQRMGEERAAAQALADAKRSHGEELYELVRNAVINGWRREDAVLMLQTINPAEDFED